MSFKIRGVTALGQEKSFFSLPGDPVELSTKTFFEHLDRSDHLRDSIYKPGKLERQENRTTRIVGKTFERVSFSKTIIQNIIFRDCVFSDCRFIGSEIRKCEFHGCSFIRTNTHKIAFRNTYIDPLSFAECLDRRKHQNIGVHLYQVLMNNSRDAEQPTFEADSRFLFLRWKRYQARYEVDRAWKQKRDRQIGKRARIAFQFLWELLFGSGIRLRHFVVTIASWVLVVSGVNYFFRGQFGLSESAVPIQSFADAFYFSSVTLTTVGFGDITPTTQLGRVVISLQGMLGLVLFAILASMLFRKIAP